MKCPSGADWLSKLSWQGKSATDRASKLFWEGESVADRASKLLWEGESVADRASKLLWEDESVDEAAVLARPGHGFDADFLGVLRDFCEKCRRWWTGRTEVD